MAKKKKESAVSVPKIIRKKIYTVEQITYEDGKVFMNRRNDGFSPIELLGMFDFISREVVDMINGVPIKLDHVKREVVVE